MTKKQLAKELKSIISDIESNWDNYELMRHKYFKMLRLVQFYNFEHVNFIRQSRVKKIKYQMEYEIMSHNIR